MNAPMTHPDPDQLLRPAQAADLLGVSVHTLIRWRRSEDTGPPFVRINQAHVAYRRRDIRKWLDAKTER